jgi:hypothetical protein
MKRLTIFLFAASSLASASTVYVLFGAGQSLSTGNTGCPAISTTQVGGNQMYNGSALVALTESGNVCDNTGVWTSGSTYQPWAVLDNGGTFYEIPQGSSASSAQPPNSPWVVVTTKETPLSSALNNFNAITGVTGSIGDNFGVGGVPMSTWGSASKISSMQTYLQAIKTAASPNTVVLAGVLAQGGESDFSGGSTAGSIGSCSYASGLTAYYANSICFQQSVQTMAQAVTGQSQAVPVIYSQMNGISGYKAYNQTCPDGTANGCIESYPVTSTASHVPEAQYQLARDSANAAVCGQSGYPGCGTFYLVGPKYHLDTGTNQGPHLSAMGYNTLGAESAVVLACLYNAGFSTKNSCGGVMPESIYYSGNTVVVNVQTPGGLALDLVANATASNGIWWTASGEIPVPYYGNSSSGCSSSACQHNSNAGFQFFETLSGSPKEILVTNVSVSGTTITLTLANPPDVGATNLQLAYAFEGYPGAPNGSYGCAWNSGSGCDYTSNNGNTYDSGGAPHGNMRTVQDTVLPSGVSVNTTFPVYHWMPHFIDNVLPAPLGAVISGGGISGGLMR